MTVLFDMDGVLVHENRALPGARDLIDHWETTHTPSLVLTNNSIFTARDLAARLHHSGLPVPEERIWTSALATADFLATQKPGGSAYVVGQAGIITALHEAGFTMTEHPAASAGPIFHASISSGKFQGRTRPTTPTGSRRIMAMWSSEAGETWS